MASLVLCIMVAMGMNKIFGRANPKYSDAILDFYVILDLGAILDFTWQLILEYTRLELSPYITNVIPNCCQICCHLNVLKDFLADCGNIMTLGFDLKGQIQGQKCQKCTFSCIFRNFTIATDILP